MVSLKSKIARDLLNYFFLHEDSRLYINEMSRLLDLDRGNLIKKLRSLEEEGILTSEFNGNQKYYSLNKRFTLLKEYKKIFSKTIGFENKVKEILSGIRGIKEAYIFGSFAKDKMDASSDIDILVIGSHNSIMLQGKLAFLQEKIGREINLISMNESEYKRRIKQKDPFIVGILGKERIKLV